MNIIQDAFIMSLPDNSNEKGLNKIVKLTNDLEWRLKVYWVTLNELRRERLDSLPTSKSRKHASSAYRSTSLSNKHSNATGNYSEIVIKGGREETEDQISWKNYYTNS